MATAVQLGPSAGPKRFAPGERVANPLPGDFILTHANAWTSWLIRVGEALRYHGRRSKYAYWSHAALIVDENGELIEAIGSGVQQRNISAYNETEYYVVRIEASAEDRAHAVMFARHCLNSSYNYVGLISVALSLLTGTKFAFGVSGQLICSSLVARALERTGEIFEDDPWHITPAALAMHYNVEPPSQRESGQAPTRDAGVEQRSAAKVFTRQRRQSANPQ